MTQPRTRSPRLAPRAGIALAMATLLAAPLGLPPAVAARTSEQPPRLSGPAPDPDISNQGGASTDPVAVDAPPDPPRGGPSAHYRQAAEHAGDVIDFTPGARVTVPFTPRAGDDWQVDGRDPRALPPGFATGGQMRDTPAGKAWSVVVPDDAAAPLHFPAHERIRDDGARPAGSATAGVPAGQAVGGASLAGAVLPPDRASGGVDGAPIGSNGLRREVFGFLPYWELGDDSTVLDWRTLSTLAYFSVGCGSNGALLKRNADGTATTGWAGWTSSKMTSLINAAHAHRTRVVLTVSCFAWSSSGAATQAALLGSAVARGTLARQVAAAVRDRGADGVNLDFEPIVAGYAQGFTKLVRAVRAELNAIAPGYQLTFDAMGTIGDQPIAEATAPGGADAVLVMGYDYRTAASAVAGSIAPLSGPEYDLTDTVKAFTARIPASKVILGVPWYGRAWSTPSDAPHGRNISGARYGRVAEPTYAQAYDLLATYGRRWDAVEQSPWTAYRKRTCTPANGCVTSWRQLYIDDGPSLRLRYDLVNRARLRGVGIWALGFEDGHPELRRGLAEKFLTDRTAPLAGVVTLPARQHDEGFRVAWTSYDESAIRGYDVQVSIDGGTWRAWLTGTTATSAIYLGTHGRTYAFRVRATDVHGNGSAWMALPLRSLGAPASITVGRFAAVVTDWLRLRSAPSTSASVLTRLRDGAALQVIGGPVKADGYTWFQVAGPIRQWGAVEALQIGGWVAAAGGGVTNVVPRGAVYATRVDAGITGLRLNGGGERVLTPNADGVNDVLRLSWTNRRRLDTLVLRLFRADGTFVGEDVLGSAKRGRGAQAYAWDGRLDTGRSGAGRVRAGTYVLQLRGTAGRAVFSAPSGSAVSPTQLARWGVIVATAPPTGVRWFTSSPASPTRAGSITYTVTFGGGVQHLATDDFSRSGTATGCRIGRPWGGGATWRVTVSGCAPGTLTLSLRAGAVMDAVSNWGPRRPAASTILIDRAVPITGLPRVSLRSGAPLASIAPATGVLVTLAWPSRDPGGAGIAGYDIRLRRNGGAFSNLVLGLPAASLPLSLAPGATYRFAVRARDRAGNVGPWTAGQTVRPSRLQQAAAVIRYAGAWSPVEGDHYAGGSERVASVRGASATLTVTARGIAWVTTRGRDRGVARVYVDGLLVATIDTRAAGPSYRYVAWSRTWARAGTHTVRIAVVGTAGRPRVAIDAFEILR